MARIRNIKLQKHNGSSLLLVIVIVTVLIILCSSLGIGVVWEANNATNQEKTTQAYYIARAGAVATAKYIGSMSNVDKNTMISQLPLHTDNTAFSNGNFSITVSAVIDGKVTIKSTGSVNNGKNSNGGVKYISDVVTVVVVVSNNTITTTTSSAIFAKSSIILEGGIVDGDITTNSIVAGSIKYYNDIITTGHKIIIPSNGDNGGVDGKSEGAVAKKQLDWIKLVPVENSPNNVVCNYASPKMPSFPSSSSLGLKNNISLSGGLNGNITTDGYYNSVVIDSDRTLTIDTSTGDKNIRIVELNMIQGNIVITGGNKVNLYVDHCTTMKGFLNGNKNLIGDKNQLQLYCNNTTPLTLSGETHIYGSVTWGTGDLIFTGSGAIKGNLIFLGKSIRFDGGSFLDSQLLYAPDADLVLNSGKIIGAIICNTVKITNSGFTVTLPSVPITIPDSQGSTMPINTDNQPIYY